MPFEITRRTFAVTAAASAVTSALPAAALPATAVPAAVHDAIAEFRRIAPRAHISDLSHTSFQYVTYCLGYADFLFVRPGMSGMGKCQTFRQLTPQDYAALPICLERFKIVAAEFMRRPSPTPYYVERKRLLLSHLARLDAILPEAGLATLHAQWTRQTKADADRSLS